MEPSELVEDEFGEYCSVTVSAAARENFITIDGSSNPQPIRDAGFTEQDVVAAQEAAYDYAITHSLDSPMLDTPVTTEEWYEAGGKLVIADNQRSSYEAAIDESKSSNLGFIVRDVFAGPLVRDRGTRVSDVELSTTDIGVVEHEGTHYLRVYTGFSASIRTTDENAIATVQRADPSKTVDQVRAENPDLADTEPAAALFIVSSTRFTFDATEKDKLVGSGMEYSIFTSSGNLVVTVT
ncbi:hypothetical protein [Microbacterium paludicola]|uniref:hypothetical protein n=1 Tax=Microbacterium paludicola TaxID=300019 RepID=UPI0011A50ED7|nr:hypothetical protein [Microbacterium paludicola]